MSLVKLIAILEYLGLYSKIFSNKAIKKLAGHLKLQFLKLSGP